MPAKKAKKPSAKKPSRLRRAAGQVAVDADQVREDLNRLLLSLENLALRRCGKCLTALVLIAERTGGEKRSLIGGVIDGAVSIGKTVLLAGGLRV
jgi:hypothetical protein